MNCCHIGLIAAFVLLSQLPMPAREQAESHQLEKLTAFAKSYGYVRFFHPGDQASAVDWSAMALFGADLALKSGESETTTDLLRKIFDPIVVDLDIYEGPEKPRSETKAADDDNVIAWQHIGIGVSSRAAGFYRSGRTNRSKPAPTKRSAPFGNALQQIDATNLQGKQFRFTFHAKVDGSSCHLQGWVRVDRKSKKRGFFDNMGDRKINSTKWKQYEIAGKVDEDAKTMFVGVFLIGSGSGLIDNCNLELKNGDQWEAIDISNPDFESGKLKPDGWSFTSQGYSYSTDSDSVASGKQSLRISKSSKNSVANLFEKVPELGEVIDSEIAPNLRIRMPLTLSKDHKYETGSAEATDKLNNAVAAFDLKDADEKTQCLANVVILWNILQHFYPYFEQINTDWEQVLNSSLTAALQSNSRTESTRILKLLVAQLHDGHGRLADPEEFRRLGFLPVKFDWIEDQLVVVASRDDRLKIGDQVNQFGNQAADDYLAEAEKLISGSPQWKRYRSLQEASMGLRDTEIVVGIANIDNHESKITLKYDQNQPPETSRKEIIDVLVDSEEPEGKVFYVDLGRAEPKDVNKKLKEFAAAKGIVFTFAAILAGSSSCSNT